ncbi:hypothetical protein [Bombella saccharophila]|uniref:Uncharacterized protein n=1 Tax=Bombella saccharophila TaxID=2967338 RepID=A0ABT3W7E2_9PROT|nr:hypothetical protein [Bombella saccharophila]MCX5614806.1 hypothetical protein [Bombella saccharophila]PHI96617.1 hypothetical protein BG621_02260 [Parasaccharibacter apium]
MSNIDEQSIFFLIGLVLSSISTILLWMHLPGKTPHPRYLHRARGLSLLASSAALAWAAWIPVFGLIGAFFCLGGWTMSLLCLLPILWAIITTHYSSTLP